LYEYFKLQNIGYQNTQEIWGRVDSDVDNARYGLGPYVSLTVEKLPFAKYCNYSRQCDDNQDGIFTFNTENLESTLLNGKPTLQQPILIQIIILTKSILPHFQRLRKP
jgi:hypothetical protein